MTWYARSYSRSVVPFPVTFQQDVTLSEHLQLAADKKVKLGTEGAALYYADSGQTENHIRVSLGTANGLLVGDKDQEAVDAGAVAYSSSDPTIAIARSTSGTQKVRLANVSAEAVIQALSGAVYLVAGGVVNANGTKVVAAAPLSLKQYATASLPTFAAGDLVFDSTTNKAKVGGAAAWEAITSI